MVRFCSGVSSGPACLDKVAKYQLSRTQRLRFYLQYCQRKRLVDKDKPRIRQILNYFGGGNERFHCAGRSSNAFERHGLASFDALWSVQLTAVDEPNVERGGWSSVFRLELDDSAFYLQAAEQSSDPHHGTPFGEPTFARSFAISVVMRSLACRRFRPASSGSARLMAKGVQFS